MRQQVIIGSDSGFLPVRRQAIIRINAGLLSIGLQRTIVSEILIEIQNFPLNKMQFKMPSANWRSFCLGLNVSHDILVDTQPAIDLVCPSNLMP